ncbi:MAG TPA: bifunctional metallophosphatase/5'-nucleotidase [Candidatus Acidoferrales bacterium]|nr:bifunctional metallophosphatase/5'-nucleotidase [Candidatus Acidoferrales bacterium]
MTPFTQLRLLACVTFFSLIAPSGARADELKLKIIAFNDFHGNLESPGKYRANAKSPAVDAGGVDFLAGYIQHLKGENPNNVVVAGGDLIGASPLASSLFHDEDTIEALDRLGLEFSAVGNHEFDKGRQELLRQQYGGCFKPNGTTCEETTEKSAPFKGAKFKYLAANVFNTSTGKTLLPGYGIKIFHGVKIAFIGLTLKGTAKLVLPSGIAGLQFGDEADAINGIVRTLRARRIKNFVVLIHEGGAQTTRGTPDINGCEGGLSGTPIENIVNRLDDSVSLVISAHTHQAYICQLSNRTGRKIVVTSAASYGRLLTDIDVTIDTKTKAITGVAAKNMVVDRTNAPGIAPDAALKTFVDHYVALASPIANREVGSITADIPKMLNPAGESPLGDLVADAQLEASSSAAAGGAVVAFTNEGGIRTDLPFTPNVAGVKSGSVTYGELFSIHPFGNVLVTVTLTGAQIKTLLEEQFAGCLLDSPGGDVPVPSTNRILQISEGFTYTWNPDGAVCDKVDPHSMRIHGAQVDPSTGYRVTINNYLAEGGDQFYVLRHGIDAVGGPSDLDALEAYFRKHRLVTPDEPHRITIKP